MGAYAFTPRSVSRPFDSKDLLGLVFSPATLPQDEAALGRLKKNMAALQHRKASKTTRRNFVRLLGNGSDRLQAEGLAGSATGPGRPPGQALTEFLLVIPLFFFLLLGVVQLALLYSAFQVVQYASFCAARAAVVRPCASFRPDDSGEASFTPAVFSAAALAVSALAPSQELFGTDLPYSWLPGLPDTPQVRGLDFASVDENIPVYRYVNASYLSAVRKVCRDGEQWTVEACGVENCGQSLQCAGYDPLLDVPGSGCDVTLEVTYLYPLTIPFVNRVVYGVFVNFSSVGRELGLTPFLDAGGSPEDVMVYPVRSLPSMKAYGASVTEALAAIFSHFEFSSASRERQAELARALQQRGWYPLPVRGRCTLTVEGSPVPMLGSP